LWLQQYTANLANAAFGLAGQQYQPFPGPTVAAPSPLTQQSWQMAQNNVGNYNPFLQRAGALTQQAAQPLTAADINQYMNPYMGDVVKGIESNLNTNLQQNVLPGITSQFVSAGQSRSPQEMQAANQAAYLNQQAIGQQVGQALNTGYQGALSAAQNQQQMEQRAGAQLGTLGALTQQLGTGDIAQIAAAGQAQDTLSQANINAALNQFYQQQQWPYQQLGFASNIVRGLPVSQNTQYSNLTYPPGGSTYAPSPLAALGGSLGALSAVGGLGYRRGGSVDAHRSRRHARGLPRGGGALTSAAQVA
jgi:hypothetical protein